MPERYTSQRSVSATGAPSSHDGAGPETCTRLVLQAIPRDAGLERILQGRSWVLASVRGPEGRRASGMAGVPHEMRGRCCAPSGLISAAISAGPGSGGVSASAVPADLHFDPGTESAAAWAGLLESADAGEAAIGLAVTNALLALDPAPMSDLDGVAWLLDRAAGRSVAVVGHFPFADRRLRPVAREMWIIERDPDEGEVGGVEAQSILARAEIVVITGSAVANHTIDELLHTVSPHANVMMLGPSTPLVSRLLDRGFDALSGVRVADPDAVMDGVRAGESFRRMSGLRRVTLAR